MIVIGLVVGAGAGIAATTSVLRNKLLKKSQQVLKDAEEKGEVLKKEKELQADRAAKGSIAKKAGEDYLANNSTMEGVVTLPSGLQYKVLREGNGRKPKATD
jgi:FKBP-type peptidyl-prolyl cis-trans isomerase FklB